MTPAALAQPGAVVQPLPSAAAVEALNGNLARLSKSPQDVDALLGAGQAALDLGDVQAANGFYTRANLVNPNLGRAKLGLAIVQLALKQPADAALNFDAADRLGEHADSQLADRGLAYDLTGQQAKAQRDYQAALKANPSDAKARLRYAVSLGVSGQVTTADAQLQPALQAGDREAWRLRAFIFAMNGRQDEAHRITQSVMPKGLADALDPYMLRVPLLTPAQKVAAAQYGDFPANVLRLTAPVPPPPARAAVQVAAATPAARDNGKKSRTSRNSRDNVLAPVTQAAATPAPVQQTPVDDGLIPPPPPPPSQALASEEPQRFTPAPYIAPPVRTAPARSTPGRSVITTPPAQATLPPTTSPSTGRTVLAQGPSDPRASFTPPPSRPAIVPATTPTPQPTPAMRSLADAVGGLDVPAAERQQVVAAVDLKALAKTKADQAKKEAQAKAKAEADAKAKAEAERKALVKANPSRIWVQVAAGKNTSALAFDMRRLRRSYADAMGDETGWTAPWGETNRLLLGPYKKMEAAKDVVAKLAKSGSDAFVWTSDPGEEVSKIGGG